MFITNEKPTNARTCHEEMSMNDLENEKPVFERNHIPGTQHSYKKPQRPYG